MQREKRVDFAYYVLSLLLNKFIKKRKQNSMRIIYKYKATLFFIIKILHHYISNI